MHESARGRFCCKSLRSEEPGAIRASKRDPHFATRSLGSDGFDAWLVKPARGALVDNFRSLALAERKDRYAARRRFRSSPKVGSGLRGVCIIMIINFVALDEGHVGTVESFTRYALSSPNSKGNNMSKDMHEKAAEHHEQAAKAHRTAAQQHGSNDHVSAKQQSAQAFEKSKAAHEHSTQAHNKSQQQK